MASGGRLLSDGRAERLLARILPEASSTDESDRTPSPPPFRVPDGLRTLLNELSKEVGIPIHHKNHRFFILCENDKKTVSNTLTYRYNGFIGFRLQTKGPHGPIFLLCRLS